MKGERGREGEGRVVHYALVYSVEITHKLTKEASRKYSRTLTTALL